jgi:hypothetical protein
MKLKAIKACLLSSVILGVLPVSTTQAAVYEDEEKVFAEYFSQDIAKFYYSKMKMVPFEGRKTFLDASQSLKISCSEFDSHCYFSIRKNSTNPEATTQFRQGEISITLTYKNDVTTLNDILSSPTVQEGEYFIKQLNSELTDLKISCRVHQSEELDKSCHIKILF